MSDAEAQDPYPSSQVPDILFDADVHLKMPGLEDRMNRVVVFDENGAPSQTRLIETTPF